MEASTIELVELLRVMGISSKDAVIRPTILVFSQLCPTFPDKTGSCISKKEMSIGIISVEISTIAPQTHFFE